MRSISFEDFLAFLTAWDAANDLLKAGTTPLGVAFCNHVGIEEDTELLECKSTIHSIRIILNRYVMDKPCIR